MREDRKQRRWKIGVGRWEMGKRRKGLVGRASPPVAVERPCLKVEWLWQVPLPKVLDVLRELDLV